MKLATKPIRRKHNRPSAITPLIIGMIFITGLFALNLTPDSDVYHEGIGYLPDDREAITRLFMAQCDDGGYTFPCGYHPAVMPAPRKPE